jgi:hypothetical protein
MSKGNRRTKRVPVTSASSDAQDRAKEYQARYGFLDTIDFKRAWAKARMQDSTLSPTHPKNLPKEVERAIILLAKQVLKLESEWS